MHSKSVFIIYPNGVFEDDKYYSSVKIGLLKTRPIDGNQIQILRTQSLIETTPFSVLKLSQDPFNGIIIIEYLQESNTYEKRTETIHYNPYSGTLIDHNINTVV